MRRFRALPAFLLALTLLAAQESRKAPVVEAILKEGKENPKVTEHLDHLVNKIGPRLTSSDKLTQACEWARDRFKGFGIANARLEEWGAFPVGFNRGPWSGEMTAPEHRSLTCATMAWSPGTQGPLEGRARLAPPKAEDVTPLYKGAWVLATKRLPEETLRRLDEIAVAGVVRGVRGELIVTDGNHAVSWERLPKRVTVFVVESQYKEIEDLVKADREVRLKFDIRNEFKKGPVPLYNVIADIPGTEKPREMVIVGGHIDSWDGATGTNDNGTGVATTLEAARLLVKAGAKPKRTIRFMLWSGEEQGLLGSAGWIRKHREEMTHISCVLVHDGGTNYVAGIVGTKSMLPLFEKAFAPVMDLGDGMKFAIREVERLPFPIGSDHDSFLQAGVPGFFWSQQGMSDYNRVHHTQHDVYESAVEDYQKHSAIVIAVGAWGLANADRRVPREGLPSGGGGQGRRLGVDLEGDGVTVIGVVEEMPASKAGILEGDRILKLGGKKVSSLDELVAAIRGAPKQTTVVVLRDGKEIALPVRFTE